MIVRTQPSDHCAIVLLSHHQRSGFPSGLLCGVDSNGTASNSTSGLNAFLVEMPTDAVQVVLRSLYVMETQLRPVLARRNKDKADLILNTMWIMVGTGLLERPQPIHIVLQC